MVDSPFYYMKIEPGQSKLSELTYSIRPEFPFGKILSTGIPRNTKEYDYRLMVLEPKYGTPESFVYKTCNDSLEAALSYIQSKGFQVKLIDNLEQVIREIE